MKNNLEMRTYVHTLQMVSDEMTLPLEEIGARHYMVKNAKITQRGALYPINPNKFKGCDILSLTELQAVLEEIREDLCIDTWAVDRQDIAVDTGTSFDALFKINKLLVSLFGIYTGRNNVVEINDAITLKRRALTVSDRRYELYCYDKAEESKGKYPYSRCEFRFKLLDDKSRDNIFKRLYETLDALPKLLPIYNQLKAEALYQRWLSESSPDCTSTPVKSLPEFFRRYADDISTLEIAKELHGRIAQGNFRNWIDKFRARGNKIHFIKKTEFRAYCQAIKKSVKLYEKRLPQKGCFSEQILGAEAA